MTRTSADFNWRPHAAGAAVFLVLACIASGLAAARSPSQGLISSIPIEGVTLNGPMAIAADHSGDLFVADTLNNVIREIGPNGKVTTVAGDGRAKYSGDGGPATLASLNHPSGVAVDAKGNLYINDENNFVVRKVGTNQIITTIVGTGKAGYSGDGGPAAKAQIAGAIGLTVDREGNLYIADTGNCVIRKVNRKGVISTVVGNGAAAYGGDGGPALLASLRYPTDVTFGPNGDLYIADYFSAAVRKVNSAQFITTVAGNGIQGYSGDAGPARQASLHGPVRVVLDAAGNLYIETDGDGRVRQVNTDGIIHTIAGNGTLGLSGDGGPAALASLHGPYGMAIDQRETLYLADTGNNRVRMISGVAFPIKVPLSNAAPGPKLVDDIEIGTFSSGTGITDWYFELPTDATVSFRIASGTPDMRLYRIGKPFKSVENPETLALEAGTYYLESHSAVRATVVPQSDVTNPTAPTQ
jgi:sugar lactone lactonase YvrE